MAKGPTADVTRQLQVIENKINKELERDIKKVYEDVPKKAHIIWEQTIEEDFYSQYTPRSYRRTRKAKYEPVEEFHNGNEYGIVIDPNQMNGAYHHGPNITGAQIFERTLQGIHGYTGGEIWARPRKGEKYSVYEARDNAAENRRDWMLSLANRRKPDGDKYSIVGYYSNRGNWDRALVLPNIKQTRNLINGTWFRFDRYVTGELQRNIDSAVQNVISKYDSSQT